ncbi:hypothetical protein Tco_0441789 [Tanacetum coccineum]
MGDIIAQTDMFDVNDLPSEKVFVAEQGVPDSKKDNAAQVNTAVTIVSTASTIPVTTATTTTTKGILLQETSESITTTTTIPSKDKGKGIMVEEPEKMKKKDQISFDEQEAIRLQAKFDEEERLARVKDEANIALTEEWNDIQAKIKVDQLLAERFQAREQEELTIEERAKLFQQLLEERRKHFAAKRAEEKRNMPPIRAQQRSIITRECKEADVDKDKEIAELQSLMKVVPDEEEVAVDTIPLATKPLSIVDFKILKEGKINYFQIIRVGGSSNWPEEDYERVLWGDLKTMFKPHVEDLVHLFRTLHSSDFRKSAANKDIDTVINKAGTKLLLHSAHFSCSWDYFGDITLKASAAEHD